MNKAKIKKCEYCKKEFYKRNTRHKFCCEKCRDKWSYRKNIKKQKARSNKYYNNNKEKKKEYNQEHKTHKKAYDKKRYESDKEERKARSNEWNEEHPEERKEYYDNNKEKILTRQKKYKSEHKEQRNRHRNNRRKIDPEYRLLRLLRTRLSKALKLYSRTGKTTTSKLYGIDYKAIIEYLKPFPEDFFNYDVHHIIPLFTFKFDNPNGTLNIDVVKKAFAPENHKLLLTQEHRKINHFELIK